ncbi:hypothetical protein PRNP1_003791 [Phytophthora ramorum]
MFCWRLGGRLGGGGRGRGRRWSSSLKPGSSSGDGSSVAGKSVVSASTRSATPGTVRVTKGFGADKHEAELDSSLARIIGSDWGDRSHQPVSLPMRIYWVVFGLVLANGLYTYVVGKDESFLVEKLKKKADEKLGIEEEENEFEEMVEGSNVTADAAQEVVGTQQFIVEQETVTTPPTSMLNSRVAPSPSGIPFIAPGMASSTITSRHVKSKTQLEQQLATLRVLQARLQRQIRSSDGVEKEELEHQVRMIDIQKEQLKGTIKHM